MNNNLRAVITRSRTANMATVDDIQKLLSEREGKHLSIINPIPFHGRPDENCYLFIRTFEQYCDYNNIKEEQKLKLFCILLKGLAANWIENLEDGKKKTYNDVKKQFSLHFQSTSTNFLNQQKLESIKHTGHASIETYIEQVIEASNNLALNDNEKKQALLRGLPPHVKAQIIVHGPDTVMETIQRLLLINQGDEVKKQAKEQEDSTMQLATLSTAVVNIEKLMTSQPAQAAAQPSRPYLQRQPPRTAWSPSSSVPRPRFQGRCYSCGRNGHISRDCFTRNGCRNINIGPPQPRLNVYNPRNSYNKPSHWLPPPRRMSMDQGNDRTPRY